MSSDPNPSNSPSASDATGSSGFDAPVGLPFGLFEWIESNAADFEPPVSNKVVWKGSDQTFMIIRGPNARSDFHIDPFDEVFMQLRGSVRLDLMIDGERQEHWIHEGQILLVPAMVPHSPQRPADTWGLVIERPRAPDEFDALVWYCDQCGELIGRKDFHVSDIEVQLKQALQAYNADETLRTCPNGHVNPIPGLFTEAPPAST